MMVLQQMLAKVCKMGSRFFSPGNTNLQWQNATSRKEVDFAAIYIPKRLAASLGSFYKVTTKPGFQTFDAVKLTRLMLHKVSFFAELILKPN